MAKGIALGFSLAETALVTLLLFAFFDVQEVLGLLGPRIPDAPPTPSLIDSLRGVSICFPAGGTASC